METARIQMMGDAGFMTNPNEATEKRAERFLLWCAQEFRKPLSSVNLHECQKYWEFLQAVSITWIQHRALKRTDLGWRAFLTQPGAASQKQALVILQTPFGGLVDAGYLVAKPMRALMKCFDLPATCRPAGLQEG